MDQPRYTLRKGEKLRHRSLVGSLFKEGRNIYAPPLRLCWSLHDSTELDLMFKDHVPPRIDRVQMLITVPKKKRRKAVDRVLMRRRIREAYRLNRLRVLSELEGLVKNGTLSLAFIYLADTNATYAEIEQSMCSLLERLVRKVNKALNSEPPAQEELSHEA